ncbi:Zn(2)-C6 fungal-type DNA-binding domain [Penicillium roqueforti FM164]|uniref:Zn(2)-C6 fungal-type DNA-binding domain n=1 Tax=Penicillium roqueforti (strain FM164) TaxID=1365484 RepID=W6QKD6_PENRF|nr:Zn(2)-C6 fungal-type DNA-binding domain [Penicillium roqueforti FM164]
MRQSLRRSCDACAKSKSSCDLRTPRCSRCVKRQVECAYANEPSTGPATSGWQNGTSTSALDGSGTLTNYRFGSLDPFDSYPQTRLPREHVQRLIYSFLHKIAFQYYPLDLNATSNPFLISWWPLALGDPALFHVSLQTACLDEELLAQKGFQTSELLMADSVALLRRKVEYMSLAVQDGTMNSVITLATIEVRHYSTLVCYCVRIRTNP